MEACDAGTALVGFQSQAFFDAVAEDGLTVCARGALN